MNTAFSSWQSFFAMGSYAFYVWLAVAATLISMLALVVHTLWRRKQLFDEIIRRQTRELRIHQSKRTSLPMKRHTIQQRERNYCESSS
ncbi:MULTISPECIES: heme exporter protein CcmD [Photorhabdus]|uniref:heme exporter protein CcmD n=1 Tax=Photorhabdus TaxID=29487 RepID=UPI000DCED3BA|nr:MULTISPECIES: heme exporter protein CcmD [Photorhabdus]MCT8342772.1 heme exporter protein CcmD [Photorhabdus kleinii]RAW99495.1 heme exporter protein CcmD [Photorhabdus sp. S10-54]RAW99601.1 heme exporter protein CcmD [Photorhabdus sp. S9-53]RAX03808.1 heme exporter protein CcmD [Photorhabdus sp. S8-52]